MTPAQNTPDVRDVTVLDTESAQRLARIIRQVATLPPPSGRLHPEYIEGFQDGLRCAADVLDALVANRTDSRGSPSTDNGGG